MLVCVCMYVHYSAPPQIVRTYSVTMHHHLLVMPASYVFLKLFEGLCSYIRTCTCTCVTSLVVGPFPLRKWPDNEASVDPPIRGAGTYNCMYTVIGKFPINMCSFGTGSFMRDYIQSSG